MNPLQHLIDWWRARDRKRFRTARYAPEVERLELRVLPATTITAAFGAGAGGGPQVTVLFDDGTQKSFFPFNPAFTGGVSVTTGQVNGTGIPDVIVGALRGGGPEVKVIDGAQLVAGQVIATADFMAFPATFTGGVTVAAGHINDAAHDDVVVAAGPGGGTRVKVFNGADLQQNQAVATADFAAFDPAFSGRITVATGPVNATGHDDVIVAAGPGGGPNVRVFDGAKLHEGQAVATANFFAFAPSFTGGVTLAVGTVNGTQHADVVTGAGPGGGPEVRVFDGAHLAANQAVTTADFFAYDPSFTGGVSLAVGNINGTGFKDVITGAGPGGGPEVRVFDGAHLVQNQAVTTADFFAFDSAFTGGVQVSVAPLDHTGRDTVIAFAGPGGGPQVIVVNATNTVVHNFFPVPLLSFFAFSPFFLGGFGYGGFFGYGNYFGYGRFLGLGGFGTGASFSGLPTSGFFTGGSPSGLFTPGGFSGFSGGTGAFSSGGFSGGSFSGGSFSGGGFSGGGFSGGSFGGFSGGSFGGFSGGGFSGGSFLRAAGGSLGVGGKAQGSGLYLSPGQLSLTSLRPQDDSGPDSTGLPVAASPASTAQAVRAAGREALSWWEAVGITAKQDQELRAVQFQIATLGGDALGRTTGGIIQLSTTAAGYGWFIDTPTTLKNGFGAANANGLSAGRMDLATVIAHEMGHLLGLEHTARPGDVMDPLLPAGTRREPTALDVAGP